MIASGVHLTWSAPLTILYIAELFVFGLGIAFALSAFFVRFRDVNYIWEIFMQALFYGSAVIYPVSLVMDKSDALAKLLLLNPVAQSIQDARHSLISDVNPTLFSVTHNFWLSLIPIVLVLATIVLGGLYFKKRSPYFAEEV